MSHHRVRARACVCGGERELTTATSHSGCHFNSRSNYFATFGITRCPRYLDVPPAQSGYKIGYEDAVSASAAAVTALTWEELRETRKILKPTRQIICEEVRLIPIPTAGSQCTNALM